MGESDRVRKGLLEGWPRLWGTRHGELCLCGEEEQRARTELGLGSLRVFREELAERALWLWR